MKEQNNSDQTEAAKSQARKIKIDREALKKWRSLPDQVRQRFKKKLGEALNNQAPTGKELRGYPGFYRLKMKRPNCRFVYRWLSDGRIAIAVVIVERMGRQSLLAWSRRSKQVKGGGELGYPLQTALALFAQTERRVKYIKSLVG